MTMREWCEYYCSANRERVLNVISLEFSKTKSVSLHAVRTAELLSHSHIRLFRLSDLVTPPRVVRELSWAETCWPKDEPVEYIKPCVQKYCLMSVKDSFTDFHIDFGGTSVWYHVLRVRFSHIRSTSLLHIFFSVHAWTFS